MVANHVAYDAAFTSLPPLRPKTSQASLHGAVGATVRPLQSNSLKQAPLAIDRSKERRFVYLVSRKPQCLLMLDHRAQDARVLHDLPLRHRDVFRTAKVTLEPRYERLGLGSGQRAAV